MSALAGSVAAVSGGLGDIGRAVARRLADDGARVALGDVASDPGAALRDLPGGAERHRYDTVDVTDADAVARWLNAVAETLGTADRIVVNAGIVEPASMLETTPDAWRRVMRVNLDGAFHLAAAAGRRLRDAGLPGRIVLIGSWAGHSPHPHIGAYSPAKAGLRMLGKCLARELAPHGILVNEVAPGFVDAGLSGRIWAEHPERREEARRRVPTGALIGPDEVAAEVAHLCDPANAHMTGSTVVMDGGLSL